MKNFKIIFAHPWLLLLLIPAVAFVLWPYFRLSRKYRRTRNRIVSLVLQVCVMFLSITVLSGVAFAYKLPNYENEVLLLVDVSYSNNASKGLEDEKNDFIQAVLDESGGVCKVGIVTFGYGQEYAAKLSYDTGKVYNDYLAAKKPDDSATDIASALNYAKTLFGPEAAKKIIVISDGLETDGDAMSVVMSMVTEGIRVDTVLFSDGQIGTETQIIGIELPNYNISVNEPIKIGVTVESSYTGEATIILNNNGIENAEVKINLYKGTMTYNIDHKFITPGPQEIRVDLKSSSDTVIMNNTFYSYFFLDVVDRILIIDKDDESSRLEFLIKDNFEFSEKGGVSIIKLASVPTVLNTLDALAKYDQIILMNIGNSDMPEWFVDLLYSYVYDLGGGLLTVGGDKTDENGNIVYETILDPDGKPIDVPVANTYNREDMAGTKYQEMLPVDCVDYTPPLAVMIVIDRSGSMNAASSDPNRTVMELAIEGAKVAVNSLNDRDYVGVISFSDDARLEIDLTPYPEKDKVNRAISNISSIGGTVYSNAIQRAGFALAQENRAKKKHILFVTDGEPEDAARTTAKTGYMDFVEVNKANGITMSVIAIGISNVIPQQIATAGGGNCFSIKDPAELSIMMRRDLAMPLIRAYVQETFTPAINPFNRTKELEGITDPLPELDGFYGGKAKSGAEVPVVGSVELGQPPIYAKWRLGKGRVGSFMCDLNGTWSDLFLYETKGINFIVNVIKGLFPLQSIELNYIKAEFTPENYSTQVLIDDDPALSIGYTYDVTVARSNKYWTADVSSKTQKAEPLGKFYKCVYDIYEPGIYEITIQKIDSNKKVVSEYTTHTAFSYSAEYNMFINPNEGIQLLTELSERGNGSFISDIESGIEEILDFHKILERNYDPRIVLIIIAIVLFLLDVAVRKFKFKWPWEIIRERKAKRKLKLGDK